MNRRILLLILVVITVVTTVAGVVSNRIDAGQKETPSPSDAPNLVRAHAPVIGPADAPVTIVEFFDPACKGCRMFYPLVKQIMAEYSQDVRLVIRYAPFHSSSKDAVKILEAARMQGLYESVLEAVLEVQPKWHRDPQLEAAWEAASDAGLDVQKAREQVTAPEIAERLETDIADVQAYNISRTPTFFVNGKLVDPFGPKQLNDLVRSEVERAR